MIKRSGISLLPILIVVSGVILAAMYPANIEGPTAKRAGIAPERSGAAAFLINPYLSNILPIASTLCAVFDGTCNVLSCENRALKN